MVTDETSGHRPFEELAAGYALDALDPAEEQRYLHHASQCPDCAQVLAGYREVAAALADTAPPAEPSSQLADRIMAAALGDQGTRQPAAAPARTGTAKGTAGETAPEDTEGARQDSGNTADPVPPPAVVPLRRRAKRWRRAAVAAAAALIAAGGIWGGLAATSTSNTSPRLSVASCGRERGCVEVTLTAAATHRTAAKVLIQRGVAWIVPAGMKANDTANQIYVLWQITTSHRPLAVGSFDVRAGAHAPVRIGGLAAPYAGTVAFAISIEHGRTVTAAPSRIAAVGRVS